MFRPPTASGRLWLFHLGWYQDMRDSEKTVRRVDGIWPRKVRGAAGPPQGSRVILRTAVN